MSNLLNDEMITLQQYAEAQGISYEAVRAQIARLRAANIKLDEYVKKIGRTQYLTPEGVNFLDQRRNSSPVVIDSNEKSKRVKELELENKELREDRDRQRDEKEVYLKKLNELLEKGVDTTKYIAIEDHKKVEEALEEREQEISELKADSEKAEEKRRALEQKNSELENDIKELRSVAVKVSTLTNEVNEKMKTINEKDTKIIELQEEKRLAEEEVNERIKTINEKESKIIELQEEKRLAEEEAKKKEQESIEFLHMGFFAMRKKLRELKNKA